MRVETFEQYLQLRSLTATTTFQEAGTLTTLATFNTGKVVAKSGDKVYLWIKQSQVSYELTLTSDLGSGDSAVFSSIAIDFNIPAGSLILFDYDNYHEKLNNKKFYFQQSLYLTAGTNGNDYLSAYGTSSFSVNSAVTLADGNTKPNRWASQFPIYVATEDCTLTKIKGLCSTDAGARDDAVISIWKMSPNIGGTSNLTINLIKAFTITSENNQNHLFDLEDTPSANQTLTEGQAIFVSIRRTGALNSGVEWYADIGFETTSFR